MKKWGDPRLLSRAKGFVYRRFLARNATLRRVARRIQYIYWRTGRKLRILTSGAGYDPDELLWVDPRKIVNCAALEGSTYTIRSQVADGDWDIAHLPFRGWDVYKAFEDRFLRGKPWEETAYYGRVLREIECGRLPWGCDSKEAFHRRLACLDALHQEIAANGFKSQAELAEKHEDPYAWDGDSAFKGHDEVMICIGRDGDLLFRDGKHRLGIAKILELPRIPVAVGFRHRRWHNLRQEILHYARGNGGKVYHPMTHPDLCRVPAQHDDGRFELMTSHFPDGCRTLLDLGSHWGYFCHRFEERGLDCTSVENHPKHVYFLKKLHRAENRRFTIVARSLLDLHGPQRYDVVLALNIFHHFLKTRSTCEAVLEFIGRLDAKAMFFETANPDEPVMQDADLNPSPDEFVRMILDHSCFGGARKIGNVARNRPLYLFERGPAP